MKEIFSLGEPDDRDQSKLEMKMWDPECPLTNKQIDQFLVVARYVFDAFYTLLINQTCVLVSFKTVIINCFASGWRLYLGQNSAEVNASVKHWNLINITLYYHILILLYFALKTKLACLYSMFWISLEFQCFLFLPAKFAQNSMCCKQTLFVI